MMRVGRSDEEESEGLEQDDSGVEREIEKGI